MIAGVSAAVLLMLSHHDPLFGLSAGFLALCLNFLIVFSVSLLAPAALESDDPPVSGPDLTRGPAVPTGS
jgi:hypothetical protein